MEKITGAPDSSSPDPDNLNEGADRRSGTTWRQWKQAKIRCGEVHRSSNSVP